MTEEVDYAYTQLCSLVKKSHQETGGYDLQKTKGIWKRERELTSRVLVCEKDAVLERSFQNDPIVCTKHKTVKLVFALHETFLHL